MSGFIYVGYRRKYCGIATKFLSRPTGFDFANGVALFPLLILTLSVFSSHLVDSLVQASKISLSVAGAFALLAILEEA
jgi:hypothetical protein